MKKILFITILLVNVCHGQQSLFLTTNKTTSLVFPFPIKHVDRGTKDILVQPLKENESILLVKASVKQFSETNLSVVTADGSVYQFTVAYKENPESLLYELPINRRVSIASYANGIADNRGTVKGIRDKTFSMEASIIGIYIKDNVIYYQLYLCNHSPIDYDIDLLRFYIRDKKKSKRTAVQENECTPLYIAGNKDQVKAYNFSVIVVALEKFTIPDAKLLWVQILEKNGGRHLQLKVSNKKIVKAVVLPDLR